MIQAELPDNGRSILDDLKGDFVMTNYLNQQEAAEMLNLPISRFMDMVRKKFIFPVYKNGSKLLFDHRDIEKLCEKRGLK